MTRHSKNNTALGFFTNAEKSKLKGIYGTKEERIGKDSLKEFDSCSLCLREARNPIICKEGHLFCKECLLENILYQRHQSGDTGDTWVGTEETAKGTHGGTQSTLPDTTTATATGIGAASGTGTTGTTTGTATGTTTTTGTATGTNAATNTSTKSSLESITIPSNPNQKDLEKFLKNQEIITKKEVKKMEKLNSFWIPSLQPESKTTEKNQKSKITCPIGNHSISIKRTTKVIFQREKKCYCCLKEIKNGMKLKILIPCGHVICSNCVKFQKNCQVCESVVTGIVDLKQEGTGFSAGGQAIAVKETLPFH